MSLEDDLGEELERLAALGLRREEMVLGSGGARVVVDGRELLNLCSNDYLGLAERDWGASGSWGSGASRLVTGTRGAHREVERAYAAFLGFQDGLLFSSGYAANVGVLSALVGPEDVVFSDELNHASIIDGARLSRARRVIYPHRDTEALASLMEQHRQSFRRALVVSEAIFSMDGTAAPLGSLRSLCDHHEASLVVDEAHAYGVLGPEGRGLSSAVGVRPDVCVVTLGKAAGACGAVAASSATIRRWLYQHARSFVFSTAPPAALCEVLVASLEVVRGADAERARVLKHARRLRQALEQMGLTSMDGESAIVPAIVGDAQGALRLERALKEQGVLARAIRPPTVPAGSSRVRFVPTAGHTDSDVDQVIAATRASFT